MNNKFTSLTDDQKQEYYDLVCDITSGLLYCDRTWSAWAVGTMNQYDFSEANSSDSYVDESAEKIHQFVNKTVIDSQTGYYCTECKCLCSMYEQGLSCNCDQPWNTEVISEADYPVKWIRVVTDIRKL